MPRYLRSLLIAALAVFSFLPARAQSASAPYDLIIRNGHIIDGTGSPWYSGDIGIRNGRIAAIGFLGAAQATRTIDAHGMVVAPGFIDMLGQSEMTILVNPHLPSKIFQGITTEFTGEGGSAAPLNDAIIKADQLSYDHLKHHAGLAHAARSTSPAWKSRAWASIWERTSARRRCGAWCSATTNRTPTPARARADEGPGARRHA